MESPGPHRRLPAFLAPQSSHALLQSPKKNTRHRRGATLAEITVDLSDAIIDFYGVFLWIKFFPEVNDGHLGFANIIPYAFALPLVLCPFPKFPQCFSHGKFQPDEPQ